MEASEPKWVNPDDIKYGVNSIRLGHLQIYKQISVLKSLIISTVLKVEYTTQFFFCKSYIKSLKYDK